MQGWEFAHRVSKRIAHFLRKNEQMSDLLKKTQQFAHSLIFSERPEQFAHDRSFLVSDLSESLMVALIIGKQHLSDRSHHSFW